MKKIAAFLLAALLLFALVGCGGNPSGGSSASASDGSSSTTPTSGGDSDRKPLVIAHITKSLTNPFFVKIRDAITNTAKSLHPEDEVITYDCNNDINRELSTVEDCIAQGVDAVILAPIDFEGSAVSVNKLKEAGIICVLIDSSVSDAAFEAIDFSVMSDNEQAGYLAMKGLAEKIGGKGKIVTISASTSAPVRERMAGRDRALDEYPDIEVVNDQDGMKDIADAMNFMANALQRDPDIVGGWGLNDPAAQGFVAAVETAGRLDDVFVVGIDGSVESCNLIKEGKQLGTSAQFPITMANQTTELLYKYIEGGKSLSAIGGERHVSIETLYVDASNVETFPAE